MALPDYYGKILCHYTDADIHLQYTEEISIDETQSYTLQLVKQSNSLQ